MPSRWSTSCSPTPVTPSRTHFSSISPRRWTATAVSRSPSIPPTDSCSARRTDLCSKRSCAARRSHLWSVPASTTTPSWSTRASAATSSRSCSPWAGRQRTTPDTSTAKPTRSSSPRTAGRCVPTSAMRSRDSGREARASSYSPAVPARRSSARQRWHAPRRPPSSSSPTPCPRASGRPSSSRAPTSPRTRSASTQVPARRSAPSRSRRIR